MPNDRSDDASSRSAAGGASDSDAAFQEELRREAAEGKELPGDMTSNSNLSGSSTWETLDSADSAKRTGAKGAKESDDEASRR